MGLDHHQVIIPWSDQAETRPQRLPIRRLLHLIRRECVEALGHRLGEVGGDVLHDHNRWQVIRQRRQQITQRLHAAGGGTDQNQPVFPKAGARGRDDDGSRLQSGSGKPLATTGPIGRLDVKGQLAGQGTDGAVAVGLGQHLQGTSLQGIQGQLRTRLGEGADHHHGQR